MADFTDTANTDLITGQPAGNDPFTATQDNPFLAPLADPKPAISAAVSVNPAQAAKNQQNATKLNVPLEAVQADPENAQNTARTNDILNLVKDSPVTNEFLANADNAAVGHDSAEFMVGMEKALANRNVTPEDGWLESLSKTLQNIYPEAKQAVSGFGEFLADRFADPASSVMFGKLKPTEGSPYDFVASQSQPLADFSQKVYKAATADIAGNEPNVPEGGAKDYANKITESFMQMLPTLVATVVTKNPTAGVITMGGQQLGQTYGESRNEYGQAPEDARARAVFFAMAEAIPEEIPLASMITKGKFLPTLLKTMGAEAVTEMMSQVLEDGYDSQTVQPDMTWGQAWNNMKQAGIIGAFLGGGMHIVSHPFVHETDTHAAQALNTAEAVDEMHQQAEAAPMTALDPAKTAEHATAVFTNEGITQVQMDSQGLAKVAESKGVDPAEYMVSLGVPSEEALQASQMGTDVTLPVDKYVNNVFMSKDYEELSQHTRFDPEGLTAAEAEQWKQNGLKQELERVSNTPNLNDTHEVTDEHLQKLEAAGFSPEEIKTLSPQDVQDLTGMSTEKARTDLPVVLAETEMGLQGMFKDAKDAGMTDKQYSTYLEGLQSAKNEARKRVEATAIKQELKKQTAEWKAQYEAVKASKTESIGNQQVFQAINNVQRDKLNREKMESLLPKQIYAEQENGQPVPTKGVMLKEIEDVHGQLFTKKGEGGGIDPEEHAIAHGYDSAEGMALDMARTPNMSTVVDAATKAEMDKVHGNLQSAIERSQEALEAVHTNQQGNVLADEVNALRDAKKEGRVNAGLVRKAAYSYMKQNLSYKDISSSKFLQASKKFARQAYQALRKGNRTEAANLKYQQLLNFAMAQQAFGQRAKMQKEQKYLKKFLKKKIDGLPEKYLDIIKPLIQSVQFSGRTNGFILGDAASAVRGNKKDWATAFSKAIDNGNAFIDVPQKLLNQLGKVNWQDMKLEDWDALVETVKNIDTVGRNEEKLRKNGEKADRASAAGEVSDIIRTTFDAKTPGLGTETAMEKAKNVGRQFAATLLNMDTISFAVDGGKQLGTFYQHIKGRIDEAMLHGYNKGQVGYQQRWDTESNRLKRLWSVYTKSEQTQLAVKNIKLPGFPEAISKDTMLAVMLQQGNAGNREALLKSGQITKGQIQVIKDNATAKDVAFVQSVWDYLDEYKPELRETHARRTGYTPEMVEGDGVDWGKNGKSKGGYYPIAYDTQKGIAGKSLKENEQDDLAKAIEDLKYGRGVASHTARGHMEARTGGDGRLMNLTTAVLHSHVHTVVYDLEMGDAISDAYRILNHPITKKAFQDVGRQDIHASANLWLEDQIMRERAPVDMFSRTVRYVRNGYTISKLGFKTGTAALQLLGLGQSGVHIGYKNMLNGVSAVIRGQWVGNNSVFNQVNAESSFMLHRSHTFSNAIADAAKVMDNSYIRRFTPGESAKFVKSAAYYMLLKTQKLVDVITYTGARQKGLELFGGDQEKAIRYAERMVAQAQGSGSFTDRSAWERGTLSKNVRQNEFVKSLTPLISYMMAKNNVAFQKTISTNFKHPGQVLRWTADMAVLYSVEALITSAIYGGIPDGEDDDQDNLLVWAAKQTGAQLASGIPILNGFIQAAQGYRSGGSLASIQQEFGDFNKNLTEQGMNEQTMKMGNDLLGTAFHYPSSEAYQLFHTVDQAANGDETLEWYEYVFGPQWKNNK